MKAVDKIRIGVLEALLKKNSVQPNIRQIKKHTGFHKATIKSSLDFLEKEGVLKGFGPKIDQSKLGFNLEVWSLCQLDLGEQKAFERFLEAIEKDPYVYWCGSIIGSGNWNVIRRHLHKDVESYHRELQKRYMSLPGYHDLVKDTQNFFSVAPVFKNESRTKTILDLVKSTNAKE